MYTQLQNEIHKTMTIPFYKTLICTCHYYRSN